jgi:nicotinamide mononucleotide (NMN) deamidase PncC
MWKELLKSAGVNIHIIATGAGAGLQQRLWEVPGSSAYLSGCSFPYAAEEQEELLGFMPEHFCSEEAAIDLASAAYMKAYKFGGKKPIGVGLTASVASEKIHRGEHRVFICVMTDDKVQLFSHTFEKGAGQFNRYRDGEQCDNFAFWMLLETSNVYDSRAVLQYSKDVTDLAKERFFARPYFVANGKRLATLPTNKHLAIMPGAYNPPHEGHLGTAQAVMDEYGRTVVFEVTAEPPHKAALTVQQLLQRAKLLQGHDRLFTRKEPYYLDKAKAFPGIPLVLGADAMVRMLDPKWGIEPVDLFKGFIDLNTKLLVAGRVVEGKFTTCEDIQNSLLPRNGGDRGVWILAHNVLLPLEGRWDISSTELRNKAV